MGRVCQCSLSYVSATVLYKLDLEKLKLRDYDNAFSYVCNLTDANVDDNRDVFKITL